MVCFINHLPIDTYQHISSRQRFEVTAYASGNKFQCQQFTSVPPQLFQGVLFSRILTNFVIFYFPIWIVQRSVCMPGPIFGDNFLANHIIWPMELTDSPPQKPSACRRGVYRLFFWKIFDRSHSVSANRIVGVQRKRHFPYQIMHTMVFAQFQEKKWLKMLPLQIPEAQKRAFFPKCL